LAMVPVAPGAIVAVRVNVAVPETGSDTVVLMLPVPAATPHAEPAEPAHVQLAPLRPAGKVSVTVAPVTAEGPALLTTMVYVVVLPGTAVAVPSDFVIDRSAVAPTLTIAVPVLLPGVGSVTEEGTAAVAVLVIGPPGNDAATDVVMMNVATALGAKSTVVPMFPDPVAAPQAPVPAIEQVHVAAPKPAGKLSVTVAPLTVEGPPLVTVMV
jgi:hypothetical protein